MDIKRLAILGLLIALVATPASGQQAGDTVQFAVPAGTDITTGPEGDKVVFVGRPMAAFTDGRDCASDTLVRTLQPVVLDAGAT